jgi:hypothetical protein
MPNAPFERALIAAACVALGTGFAQAQAMYKWVDEKGTTHFSESPPPDDVKTKTKPQKVEPKVTPPSSSSAYKESQEKWRTQEADFRRRQVDARQKDAENEQAKQKRATECERAKSRLVSLQNTHRIYRDNPDGTRTYMEDSERNEAMARQRDIIKQNCD